MGFPGSFTVSGVPNSPPSGWLHGLKLGHKIFFEDVGVEAPAKSGGGPSRPNGSRGGSPAAPKKVKGVVQGGRPPRCQVAGCKVDLSNAKAYYLRHKVCVIHSKSAKVIVAGLEQRFCQQCSRFHQLPEFDLRKRSCRRRLAGHNERRRKPPIGSLFPLRYGRLSSPVFEDDSSGGGVLVNFSSYATSAGMHVAHPGKGKGPSNDGPATQGSSAGTGYPGIKAPSREHFTGVSDTDHACSLLSDQPWASRTQAWGLGAADNSLMNNEGSPVLRTTIPSTSCFSSCCSDEISINQALDQVSHPMNGTGFAGEVDVAEQSGRRPYAEFEPCRPYHSTHLMHWSL